MLFLHIHIHTHKFLKTHKTQWCTLRFAKMGCEIVNNCSWFLAFTRKKHTSRTQYKNYLTHENDFSLLKKLASTKICQFHPVCVLTHFGENDFSVWILIKKMSFSNKNLMHRDMHRSTEANKKRIYSSTNCKRCIDLGIFINLELQLER